MIDRGMRLAIFVMVILSTAACSSLTPERTQSAADVVQLGVVVLDQAVGLSLPGANEALDSVQALLSAWKAADAEEFERLLPCAAEALARASASAQLAGAADVAAKLSAIEGVLVRIGPALTCE